MSKQQDFRGSITEPRGAEGTIGPVPGADPMIQDNRFREQNAKTMRAFWARREADTRFRPKPVEYDPATPITTAPKPSALPTPAESETALQDARASLHEAIQRHAEMQAVADAAADALARGEAAVASARDRLGSLGDVNHLVAAWRAGRVAAHKDADVLPPDLQHRRDEHIRLTTELEDATRTTALLGESFETEMEKLRESADRLHKCVALCIDAHAQRLAAEMMTHQRAAYLLLQKLMALDSVAIGGRHYERPRAVHDAVGADPRPWSSTSPRWREAPLQAWQEAVARLTRDADAPIE